MKIISAAQRTPEWFAARAGKFTASCFSDLMAVTKSGPAASRRNLITRLAIERLTGTQEEGYTNAAMQRGTELEPIARSEYEARAGVMVQEIGFALHDDYQNVGASVDGLVGDDGLVEIKCPNSANHFDYLRTGSHAQEYRWQIQGQLWVSGRAWCDAVSFDPRFPEYARLAIVRVKRDEDAIKELVAACAKAEEEVSAQAAEIEQLQWRKAA